MKCMEFLRTIALRREKSLGPLDEADVYLNDDWLLTLLAHVDT